MTTKHYQPFWFQQALEQEQPIKLTPLNSKINADVCIVGGGYTGLWTAIKLKQKQPELNVVIIEAGLCGQGASGRNGGAMLTWSTKFPTLANMYGTEEACQLVKASERAVWQINDFCQQHNINADINIDGAYYTATNQAQAGLLNPIIAKLSQHKLNYWQQQTKQELLDSTGSALNQAGFFTANAGSLHPGKLVRGLARVAKTLGVKIYEHSPMVTIRYPQSNTSNTKQVITQQGQVSCQKLVMATNSWLAKQMPRFKRSILLVSSDMVITDPIPTVLDSLGLNHGAAVIDSRTFVHYYRTTADGRLMLGKGGNTFAFGNRMLDSFNQSSRYQQQLSDTLKRFFPNCDMPIACSWNGASDRSVSGFPFFGELEQQVFYGLGYSGNGVVQTYIGGEILSSLVLEENNQWSQCSLVNQTIENFPHEPIRYLGANMVRNAIRRKERAEDNNQKVSVIVQQLAKLAGNAGKADYQ